MSSSSSPVPAPEEATTAAMTREEENQHPVSPANSAVGEEETVDKAPTSPKKSETKLTTEDTNLNPTVVSNNVSAESDDKPVESPSTPATLSVNEDNLDEEEETPQEKPKTTSSSSRKRVPYKYDPNKVTLRFIFANRDGISVTLDCQPADTVGEVKGALLSVWPKGM